MASVLKPCLCGRDKAGLDGVELTVDERRWLEEAIVARRVTPTSASKRFNLHTQRLKKYAAKLRKGCIFASKISRPTIMDGDSRKAHVEFLTGKTYQTTT